MWEVKEIFPDVVTNMISMEAIMWDVVDADYDLSIVQTTMDHELNFDYYGYMTYHAGNTTGYSSYTYQIQMEQGFRAHGDQFQPWVGWWSNNGIKYCSMEQDIVYD